MQANYLKDYQPADFSIESIALDFDLHEDVAIVSSVLQVNKLGRHQKPLVLHGRQQALVALHLNNQLVDYVLTDEQLTIGDVPDQFELKIVSHCQPHLNTSLEGLYCSGGLFCTQCESHGFRKITYYLDRPDVLSVFTVTIRADKAEYPVLLSNGNLIDQGDLAGGRHFVRWHDPHQKPCYLFALVAGDLALSQSQMTTMSGRTVDLKIYTLPADQDKTSHAMQSLKEAMIWDEQVYGCEYDLDTYMIVAVPDFNMGAMENKGLNIFNTRYTLANDQTATDQDYQQIQAVIAHEYFHNWSGNRVTCRDWFQLSLKEGLTVFRDQSFTMDHHSALAKRIDDVRIIRSAQFAEDASPMAHPIRPSSYVEMNNFYTVTVYNKGAEVIRMLQTLLGQQRFIAGVKLYFQRHDGQAVTCDDFVQALADASGRDLTQFMRWYCQAGTPIVTVKESYDADQQLYALTLSQATAKTADGSAKAPFHLPIKIGLLRGSGQPLNTSYQGQTGHKFVLELTEEKQVFTFSATEKPVLSMLRDFSAPVKVVFERSEQELLLLSRFDDNLFNRWQASQTLAKNLLLHLAQSDAWHIPLSFITFLSQALSDQTIDLSLLTEILTLPDLQSLAQEFDLVDMGALVAARRFLLKTIAEQLSELLLARYQQLALSSYRHHADDIAKRKLRHRCLSYLVLLPDQAYAQLAYQQFIDSDNMTDQLAALHSLAANRHTVLREKALQEFYQQWQDEALVVDKWLQVQALADHENTFELVTSLTEHPAFDRSNPNKVYALVVAFASNLACFHRTDGASYQWLATQVKLLNNNPQVAARVVRALMNWQHYAEPYQSQMKTALMALLAYQGLCSDVREIVEKSLA